MSKKVLVFLALPMSNRGMVLRLFGSMGVSTVATTKPYAVFEHSDSISEILATRFKFDPMVRWKESQTTKEQFAPTHGDELSTYCVKLDFVQEDIETSIDVAFLREFHSDELGTVRAYLVMPNWVRATIISTQLTFIPGYYRHDLQHEHDPIVNLFAHDLLGYGVNAFGE